MLLSHKEKSIAKTIGVDIEEARAKFDYDPITGILSRKTSEIRWKSGRRSGSLSKEGYRTFYAFGHHYKEHRFVWFLHYGVWPKGNLDHINGDKSDNRISNLREFSAFWQNKANTKKPKSNSSGFKGVIFRKDCGRYRAILNKKGIRYELGHYDTAVEAAIAYDKAAIKHFGKFALTNKKLGLFKGHI